MNTDVNFAPTDVQRVGLKHDSAVTAGEPGSCCWILGRVGLEGPSPLSAVGVWPYMGQAPCALIFEYITLEWYKSRGILTAR